MYQQQSLMYSSGQYSSWFVLQAGRRHLSGVARQEYLSHRLEQFTLLHAPTPHTAEAVTSGEHLACTQPWQYI